MVKILEGKLKSSPPLLLYLFPISLRHKCLQRLGYIRLRLEGERMGRRDGFKKTVASRQDTSEDRKTVVREREEEEEK